MNVTSILQPGETLDWSGGPVRSHYALYGLWHSLRGAALVAAVAWGLVTLQASDVSTLVRVLLYCLMAPLLCGGLALTPMVFLFVRSARFRRYALTARRAVAVAGLWQPTGLQSVPWSQVQDVVARTRAVDRLLGSGRVHVVLDAAARRGGAADLWFVAVRDPEVIAERARRLLAEARA